ncbi:MAG: tyrosine recombinase [Candidatus Cohnella colombiensis]|uniref:Tyrosine recombinase XerC n=1 Tax=Candidatus Cohnella colombiensis TaxID=3121368 RepID=A0AA95JBN7_9BACL|nr:MAG: tyrosine recombinase [Cohnella sp.]
MTLRQWLQLFFNELLEVKRVSTNTLQSYNTDLNHFVTELENQSIVDPQQLRSAHLQAYLNELRSNGRSPATLNRKIVSIRQFCKYMTIQRALPYDPALQLESAKLEKKRPLVLSQSEMDKLLELPNLSDEYGLRDRAMIELLYASGLRVSELIALDLGHVRLEMGFLLCMGSGGKERMVPIGSQSALWVSKYIHGARGLLLNKDEHEDALFVNHLGLRLTRQGFWKTMKKYGKLLGVDLSPHTLRHTFASHLLDNGADIRAVQEMLGHVAPSTTQLYQKAPKLKIKEVYERNHPRARTSMTQSSVKEGDHEDELQKNNSHRLR